MERQVHLFYVASGKKLYYNKRQLESFFQSHEMADSLVNAWRMVKMNR